MSVKYGQLRPRTVSEARKCDAELDEYDKIHDDGDGKRWITGTESAARKEVEALDAMNCFKYLDDDEEERLKSENYDRIHYTTAWDIKASGQKKCRLAARGDKVPVSEDEDTYASVLESTSARLCMISAAANKQDVVIGDISSAFIHSRIDTRLYIRCGPEFGDREGKIAVVQRGLYGLRQASRLWQNHLSVVMLSNGWIRSKRDENVWLRKEKRMFEGQYYREMYSSYVDDALVASHWPGEVFEELERCLKVKFAEKPDMFLGGEIRYGSTNMLVTTAANYIGEIVQQHEREVGKLPGHDVPSAEDDHPELLVGEEATPLDGTEKRKFQRICGQLLWVSGGLGRIDVSFTAASLSRFGSRPQKGHC